MLANRTLAFVASMKKLILIIFLGAAQSVPAQTYFDFATASPTSGVPSGWSVSPVTAGNTSTANSSLIASTSASSGYFGASGGNNASIAAKEGILSISTSSYFEVTLTPAANEQVDLSGMSFGMRSTSSGPASYSIYSSIDGYANSLAMGSISNNSTWTLNNLSFSTSLTGEAGSAVTIRIYGSGGSSASSGNWRIDDLKFIPTTTQPVSLLAFSARTMHDYVEVSWSTQAELNSKTFEVFKSADGRKFSSIGKVAASGMSTTRKNYSFLDYSPSAAAYYQLVQTDADGRSSRSEVLYVERIAALDFQIDASSAGFDILMVSSRGGLGELTIRNLNGQKLISKKVACQIGHNRWAVDEICLPGLFIITVRTPEGIVTKKYLKQ